MLKLLFVFSFTLQIAELHAMEANFMQKPDGYKILLNQIQYPQKLNSDLVSGLSTELLIQCKISIDGRTINTTNILFSIKYDLWEEQFRFQTTDNEGVSETSLFYDRESVLEALSEIEIPLTSSQVVFERKKNIFISIRLLLNPIEQNRLKLIREFVAENTVPGSTTSRNNESNALFNLIFQQYTEGVEVGAIWQASKSLVIEKNKIGLDRSNKN